MEEPVDMLGTGTRRLHIAALLLGTVGAVAFIMDGRLIGALLAAMFVAQGASGLLSGRC